MRILSAAALLVLAAACGSSSSGNGSSPDGDGTAADPLSCTSTIRAPVADLVDAGMVQDLGTLQVGQQATFQVPPETRSLLIVSQAVPGTARDAITFQGFSIPNVVVPTNVRDPNGVLVWDDTAGLPDDLTGLPAYAVGFDPVAGTFGIPNTSAALGALPLTPGTWSFTVNDWATECLVVSGCVGGSTSAVYQTYVVTKGLEENATLDLEVYLATDPANPVTALTSAANAASSSAVARWRSSVGAFLANAGISLGTVRFNDLSGAARARHAPGGVVDISEPGPCGNLAQLFATATVQSRAVHVFLADELRATSNGTTQVIGVDGAIPGPSGFPGTINGGAIVGVFDQLGQEAFAGACSGTPNVGACGSDFVAYVTAHEIGHWLGLFHTTERSGQDFDPLSDTATCPCSSCAPANQRAGCGSTTLVMAGTCTAGSGCGGGRNLMFWLVDPRVSTGELSPEQGQVARQNPVVR